MAAEDGSQSGLTISRSLFPTADTTTSQSVVNTYPMQELLTGEPRQNEHTVGVSPEERINGLETLHEIDTSKEGIHEQRPRRRFRIVSKALPFLLSALTIYIYYVYTIQVCILYLVAFNLLVILYFISYAMSIFCNPGTPLNPPVKGQGLPIPVTTTPYRHDVPSVPLQSSSNDQANLDSLLPQPPQDENLSTPSTVAGHSSNAQHVDPHLESIVTTPKYPTVAVAPAGQNVYGYSFSNDASESRASHISINISSEGPIHENGDSSQSNGSRAEASGGVEGSRVKVDNQGAASRPRDTSDENNSRLPVATLSISKRDGRPRWCDICKIIKPDRSHHCSECNSCVLRMDHHCPWVNGCIGFGNYKFFYLFILYGSLSALWVVATMIPLLLQVLREYHNHYMANGNATTGGSYMINGTDWNTIQSYLDKSSPETQSEILQSFDVQWVVITVIAILLALLIVSFTGAHTSYILRNLTTIEALQNVRSTFVRVQYRKTDPTGDGNPGGLHSLSPQGDGVPPSFLSEIEFNVVMVEQGDNVWDRGSWGDNWCSVMGPVWWLWLIPYHNAEGDGIHEVYNEKVYNKLVTDALAQARMQIVTIGLQEDPAISGQNVGLGERTEAIMAAPSSPRMGSEIISDSSSINLSTKVEPTTSTPADRILSDANRRLKTTLNSDSNEPGKQPPPRKNTSASSTIRLESINETPTPSIILEVGSQDNYMEDIVESRSRRAGQRQDSYFDGGSTSQIVPSSDHSTPRRSSIRSQNSRQNSPKQSVSSTRRRQRTMSGSTSGSYAGPIREFGMGL
ncbi:palmitoyltransferase pfa5, partial [Mortierella sp. AD010]